MVDKNCFMTSTCEKFVHVYAEFNKVFHFSLFFSTILNFLYEGDDFLFPTYGCIFAPQNTNLYNDQLAVMKVVRTPFGNQYISPNTGLETIKVAK